MNTLTYLVIDPGPTKSGYVICDNKTIKQYGKIENKKIREFDFSLFNEVIIEQIDSVHGKTGFTLIETAIQIGRFRERFKNKMVYFVGRKEALSHFKLKRDADVIKFLKEKNIKLLSDSWQAYLLYYYHINK